MKPLEKIINTIRIAPHGIIPSIVGAGLLIDTAFKLGLYNNVTRLAPALEGIRTVVILNGLGYGIAFGIPGFINYKKFKSFIEKHGIDKRHVKPNLKWYCERQAYKAAAYACGLGDKFNSINKNYPQDKKYFKWIPEI